MSTLVISLAVVDFPTGAVVLQISRNLTQGATTVRRTLVVAAPALQSAHST